MSACTSPQQWRGCYTGQWDLWTAESFAHPAKMAPGLCHRILGHLAEMGMLPDGGTILDPMGGIGTTALCATLRGYQAVTVELEPRFVDMQRANLARMSAKVGRELPWTILQGDARKLSELIAGGLVSLTSPPYGHKSYEGLSDSFAEWRAMNGRSNDKPGVNGMKEGYGESTGQIGKLRDTPADKGPSGLTSLVSPPYGHSGEPHRATPMEEWRGGKKWGGPNSVVRAQGYGSTDGNIGNMPDGQNVVLTSPPYADTDLTGERAFQSRRDANGARASENPHEGYAAVTSPPYIGHPSDSKSDPHPEMAEGSVQSLRGQYGDGPGQIAQRDAETYLEAMRDVYAEVAKVATTIAVVVKDPTRNGKLRLLGEDTAKLLEATGWRVHCWHHAVLFDEVETKDLFGETTTKPKGRLSFFKRLSYAKGSPVAQYEHVIVAVRA